MLLSASTVVPTEDGHFPQPIIGTKAATYPKQIFIYGVVLILTPGLKKACRRVQGTQLSLGWAQKNHHHWAKCIPPQGPPEKVQCSDFPCWVQPPPRPYDKLFDKSPRRGTQRFNEECTRPVHRGQGHFQGGDHPV